jgi:ADP-ribose pyrophosphatase YjhB (NUDIX family)
MKEIRNATLCFLIDDEKICLAMKKKGFGNDKWNGVGGKVGDHYKDESIEEGLIREVKEEIFVDLKEYEKVAELKFSFEGNNDWDLLVHTYLGYKWEGKPKESEEMRPQWYMIKDIPYDDMWDVDRNWLPKVLEGKKLRAEFMYDEDNEAIGQEIEEIDSL